MAVAALTGCAESTKAAAQPMAANDVIAQMHEELSHSLSGSDAVGTTSLTSAVLEDLGPMPLPEDRMSLSVLAPPTWGVGDDAPLTDDQLPATRK
jgi:hypothetical protein